MVGSSWSPTLILRADGVFMLKLVTPAGGAPKSAGRSSGGRSSKKKLRCRFGPGSEAFTGTVEKMDAGGGVGSPPMVDVDAPISKVELHLARSAC